MESNTLRTCRVCLEEKDISQFYKNGKFIRWQCLDCIRKQMRQNYNLKKDQYKNRQLKNRYNMTLSEYAEMLEAQNWKCAVCGVEQNENTASRSLAVDHNHSTNKVRGLLCSRCNLAVEFLESNPGWADKAIAYLESYK